MLSFHFHFLPSSYNFFHLKSCSGPKLFSVRIHFYDQKHSELPDNDRCTLNSYFLRKFKDRSSSNHALKYVMSCHPDSMYLNFLTDLTCLCVTPRIRTFAPLLCFGVIAPAPLPPPSLLLSFFQKPFLL